MVPPVIVALLIAGLLTPAGVDVSMGDSIKPGDALYTVEGWGEQMRYAVGNIDEADLYGEAIVDLDALSKDPTKAGGLAIAQENMRRHQERIQVMLNGTELSASEQVRLQRFAHVMEKNEARLQAINNRIQKTGSFPEALRLKSRNQIEVRQEIAKEVNNRNRGG